jgi:hypothetical protein
MTEMRPENVGRQLKDYLLSHGVVCDAGASEGQIALFEDRYNVRLPADLRDYFGG